MLGSDTVYQNILEQLTEGIYYVDTDRKITYWNKAAENITGYSKEEVIGRQCSENILRHLDENCHEMCKEACPLADAVTKCETKEKNIFLHHKDGHRVHVFTRVSPITDNKGRIMGAVELFSDISKNIHSELICELEQLKKEVYTDALTGTGNRKYAELTLNRRFDEWKKQNISFSLLFIDIDDFKTVNDTHGHNDGDKVLKMVANSIVGLLRSLDTVCRWGGEEFIVISPNTSLKVISAMAERIRGFIEKSWITTASGSEDVYTTVSIGSTTVRGDDTPVTVMTRADKAMYQSKINGKNRVTIL